MEQTGTHRVPFWVNLLLTLAFFIQATAMYMFHQRDITKREAMISMRPYIRDHKLVELVLGIAAIVVSVALFVWIVREVWNRVITKVVTVPQLTFSEAYALSFLFFAVT